MIKQIYQHSYWILGFGTLLIALAAITVYPISGIRHEVSYSSIALEAFIAVILLCWVIIARRLRQASKAYAFFFFGCATLIWMLQAKVYFDISNLGHIRINAVIMVVKALALSSVSYGWYLWSSDYQHIIRERLEQQGLTKSSDETDSLTGLFNRQRFDMTLALLHNESAHYSLILFDLDQFTSINHRFGSAVGDLVLEQFASQITRNIRVRDYAFRLGGEEFAVLLRDCPEARVKSIVQSILQGIRQNAFTTDNGSNFYVTTSAGVCIESGADSPSKVYRRADAALYQAKLDGRDRIVYA